MIPTRTVDRETHVSGILMRSETALEHLYHYYKFERHRGVFPEKLYFLLSHCAQLLFSLWLTEDESPVETFGHNALLGNLVSELDFATLRYVDYKRRTLHANAYEEHLKNEPRWFRFWLDAMQKQGTGNLVGHTEFMKRVLSYTNDPGFLEGRVTKKQKKALLGLMKTDVVAQLLHRSSATLEAMISAIVLQFTTLDQTVHTTEQIASLLCLLRQARRTIINESLAEGPHSWRAKGSWRIPSTLGRFGLSRPWGTLRVVPKRDGGDIVCTYKWKAGSSPRTRSWIRVVSSLPCTYEEELFRTWSYDTGECVESSNSSTGEKAYWLLQNTEVKRLKAIFHHVERVLQVLAVNPGCTGLIADATSILINRQVEWQASRLDWTYIKRMDRLINGLSSAYRDARILGGSNPGQKVIADAWPVPPAECQNHRPLESPKLCT